MAAIMPLAPSPDAPYSHQSPAPVRTTVSIVPRDTEVEHEVFKFGERSMGRTIDQDPHAAAQQLKALAKLGIDLGSVTQRLEDEGVAKFAADYDVLLLALRKKVEESAKEYAAS